MKATIQKIIEEISALSVPMDPELVQKIFINYPEFISPTLPKALEHTWTQLDFMRKLAQQGMELKGKIMDIKSHEDEITLYTERGIVLQSELTQLEVELSRLQDEISGSRAELTLLYNKLLLALNLQTPEDALQEASPDSVTKKQLKVIVEIHNEIQRDIKLLTLPTAKLKLLELKAKQTELLKQINQQMVKYHPDKIIPSAENEEGWKLLQHVLTEKLKVIYELQPQLEKLQEEFADCLSTTDTQKKITALEISKELLSKELIEIDQKIAHHELTKATQLKLIEEFQQANTIQALIERYKSKVDSPLSYINLNSWRNWYSNKDEYNKQQKEHTLCLDFLTLLVNQKEKQIQQSSLVTQIEILTKISNATTMSAETEGRLVEKARKFLNSLPGCKVPIDFNAASPATDYYLLLINNIFLIPDNIKQYEIPLAFVNELAPIITELLGYRKDYNLPMEQDELLPSIEELQKAIPEETGLTHKKEQLLTCELYIDKVKLLLTKLKLQTQQLVPINQKKKEIEFNITVLKFALENKKKLESEKAFASQRLEHTVTLATCQTDMSDVMKKVKAIDETREKPPTEKPVVSITKTLEPIDIIDEPPPVVLEVVQQEPILKIQPSDLTNNRATLPSPHTHPIDAVQVIKQEERSEPITKPSIETIAPIIAVKVEPIRDEVVDVSGHRTSITDVSPPVTQIITKIDEPVIEVSPQDNVVKPIIVESPIVNPTVQQLNTEKPHVVEDALAAIDILPVINLTKDEDSLINTHPIEPTLVSVKTTTVPNNDETIQLNKWHSTNIEALSKYSEELRNWYLELYAVVALALKQTPYSHKYSHLIRDIFFELQSKQEVDILYAYKRMCPSPMDNCEILLALKPDNKISDNFYPELSEEQTLPQPLQKLNNHYKQLKMRHPVAAELLLQTIQSLYGIYKNPSHTSPTFVMPSIADDPRYDVLKRHRGFLRVWEAIEDLCRWITGKITGQPEYEYRKKPSFFKTHSEELIEEAELFVTKPQAV